MQLGKRRWARKQGITMIRKWQTIIKEKICIFPISFFIRQHKMYGCLFVAAGSKLKSRILGNYPVQNTFTEYFLTVCFKPTFHILSHIRNGGRFYNIKCILKQKVGKQLVWNVHWPHISKEPLLHFHPHCLRVKDKPDRKRQILNNVLCKNLLPYLKWELIFQ